jgi:hypothetical protein
MIRNLMCHILPRHDGQKWRRTVDHLLRRWHVFNGRKVVAIAVDECCDTCADVREAFGDKAAEIEFLEFVNNPDLREVHTFVPMLERIESIDPEEITFSCHAKGSTRPHDDAMSHPWADVMFGVCLDAMPLVECVLRDHSMCGAFRLFGRDNVDWIFAGTFYWFRHDKVFSRDWRNVPQIWTGTENWPCTLFRREEVKCLFMDNCQTPYDEAYWETTIFPAFRFWQDNLRRHGLSMTDYSPPSWFLQRHPNFRLPTGRDGYTTTPPVKRSWRRQPIFQRLASLFSTG